MYLVQFQNYKNVVIIGTIYHVFEEFCVFKNELPNQVRFMADRIFKITEDDCVIIKDRYEFEKVLTPEEKDDIMIKVLSSKFY